ncbi:MAG: hypothetical protein AAFV29_01785, partial [Myxococcota bacterium]
MDPRPIEGIDGLVSGSKIVARRKPKPFNNPFTKAAEALKKELKQAKKEARKARIEAAMRPSSSPTQPPEGDLSEGDRDLFLQAVGDPSRVKPIARPDNTAFLAAVGDAVPLPSDPRGQLKPSLPPDNARHIPR